MFSLADSDYSEWTSNCFLLSNKWEPSLKTNLREKPCTDWKCAILSKEDSYFIELMDKCPSTWTVLISSWQNVSWNTARKLNHTNLPLLLTSITSRSVKLWHSVLTRSINHYGEFWGSMNNFPCQYDQVLHSRKDGFIKPLMCMKNTHNFTAVPSQDFVWCLTTQPINAYTQISLGSQ